MVFYLGWARGFPRKNHVFFISADIYFLLCQEHPVRTGISAVCENLIILDKTQFTPLLCFVLSNLTKDMEETNVVLSIKIIRDNNGFFKSIS